MRFPKTFSAFALLIGLSQAAGAQTCTPKVPASSLIEAPKWQMSINPTLPPQQFVDDKGELQGLNVELARDRQAHLRRGGVPAHGLPADDPGAALRPF